MKHRLIYDIGIILFLLTSTQCLADPAVMITSYEVTPSILLPGDEAVLSITITNTETTATITDTDYINSLPVDQTIEMISATLENVWISSDGDGKGHTVKASDNYEDIGDLAPGSTITLDFSITAHQNITEGLYFPVINVDVETYQDVQYPIPIRVSNTTLSIVQKEVPSKISFSGSTSITLTIINRREAIIEDAEITLLDSESFISNPKSEYLGSLNSEEKQDVTFSLQPLQKGKQNLSFYLTYRNGYNYHNETITIPIEITESIDVSPVIYSFPKTIQQGKSKRVTLEVFNAKTDSITGVIVTPKTNLPVTPSQYFIGSMDPDDVFSASFDILTDSIEVGNYSIDFFVTFKQNNNYYESPALTRTIEIIPGGITDDSGSMLSIIGIILFIIILLIIGYFYYMKRRPNK